MKNYCNTMDILLQKNIYIVNYGLTKIITLYEFVEPKLREQGNPSLDP